MQLGSGALGPLDAMSGIIYEFTNSEIGLLGSSHFIGFLFGCWVAPRLMGLVGHIRSFAIFTSLATISCLSHPILVDPWCWSVLRVIAGVSIAGTYTVIEAWMNATVENSNRGKIVGAYRFVDVSASVFAQLMIGYIVPASFMGYNVLALIFCACLFPIMLTSKTPPIMLKPPRLSILKTIHLSPLAGFGVLVGGLAASVFRMVGPLFGLEIGFSQTQVALFLASGFFGGAVIQIPIGFLADKFDRRWILIYLSGGAALVSTIIAVISAQQAGVIYFLSFCFGMTTFPIFSISSAYANDLANDDFYVDLAASLIFIFAIGAIIGPYLAAALMEIYRPNSMFLMLTLAHLLLITFGMFRIKEWKTPIRRTSYFYIPRTTFVYARFLKKKWMKKDTKLVYK